MYILYSIQLHQPHSQTQPALAWEWGCNCTCLTTQAGRQERVGKDYCLDVIQTNAGSLHPSCQPNSVHKDYGSQNGSVDRASWFCGTFISLASITIWLQARESWTAGPAGNSVHETCFNVFRAWMHVSCMIHAWCMHRSTIPCMERA